MMYVDDASCGANLLCCKYGLIDLGASSMPSLLMSLTCAILVALGNNFILF